MQVKPTSPKHRKTVVGAVVSAKMQKTLAVEVMRLEKHVKYQKYIRRSTVYKAHDERSEAKEGDTVRIEETRPLSKTKRWRLVEVLRQGTRVEDVKSELAGVGGAPPPSGEGVES